MEISVDCESNKILKPELDKHSLSGEFIRDMLGIIFKIFTLIICLKGLQGVCQKNWKEHVDRCYQNFEIKESWGKAKKHCIGLNASLSIIVNNKTNNFFKNQFVSSHMVWLGLRKRSGKEKVWIDGSQFNFPEHLVRNDIKFLDLCLGTIKEEEHDGIFVFENCSQKAAYVCEKEVYAESQNHENPLKSFADFMELKGPNNFTDIFAMMRTFEIQVERKLRSPTLKEEKVEIAFSTNDISFSLTKINRRHYKRYTSPANDDSQVRLTASLFNYTDLTNEVPVIIHWSYPPFGPMTTLKDGRTFNKVSSIKVFPSLKRTLEDDDRISIEFGTTKRNVSEEVSCVFWDHKMMYWSIEGCTVVDTNPTVVCLCNHMTEFSILFKTGETKLTEKDRQILELFTHIGCSTSVFFLIISLCIIVFVRKLRHQLRYQIHANFNLALIFANLTFILTDKAHGNRVWCSLVAMLLFYFFLSSFAWMACEGAFIWRGVIDVFTETDNLKCYLPFGWLLPLLIVGVTAGIFKGRLFSKEHCWLSRGTSAWMFIGPALLVIVMNSVVMLKTLSVRRKHLRERNTMRKTVQVTAMLLILFGCTWIFGIFAVNSDTKIFEYIFTVLNSLQGFFFFVFFIALSKHVKREVRRSIRDQDSFRSLTTRV